MSLTVAGTLVLTSLAKAGMKTLITKMTDEGFFRDLLQESAGDGIGKIPFEVLLNGLNLKRATRNEISKNPTIFDLAGIAWAQELASRNDDDLAGALGRRADEVRRILDPRWFVRVSLEADDAFLKRELGGLDPSGSLSPQLATALARSLSAQIVDEFGMDGSDRQIEDFVGTLIASLSTRVNALYMDIPGVVERLTLAISKATQDEVATTRRLAEDVKAILDGSSEANEAFLGMDRRAREILGWVGEDVFHRKEAQAGELPLLPLAATYVEPLVISARHKDEQLRALAVLTSMLLDSDCKALTVLRADFGFGKSLTCKTLAANLAAAWMADAAQPYPVYIHMPDALSGHVSTFEAVVRGHLAQALELGDDAVRWLWSRSKISLVLILDSFDEVVLTATEAESWVREIRKVAGTVRRSVLLATRPYGIQPTWLGEADCLVDVQQFDEQRIEDWLRAVTGKVHNGALTARTVMERLGSELAGIPILLLMAAWGWKSDPSTEQLDRTGIYERFFAQIARGKWKGVQEDHPVIAEGTRRLETVAGEGAYRRALEMLAWEHLKSEQNTSQQERESAGDGLSIPEVARVLSSHFGRTSERRDRGLSDEDISAVVRSLVLSMFLRPSAGQQGIRFSHKSFREFLCARHLFACFRTDIESGAKLGGLTHAALAEVNLTEGEIAFCTGISEKESSLGRQQTLELLDCVYFTSEEVFFQRADKAKGHNFPDGEMFWRFNGRHRSARFKRNAEIVAAKVRGLPEQTTKMISGYGHNPAEIDPYRAIPTGMMHGDLFYEKNSGEQFIGSNGECAWRLWRDLSDPIGVEVVKGAHGFIHLWPLAQFDRVATFNWWGHPSIVTGVSLEDLHEILSQMHDVFASLYSRASVSALCRAKRSREWVFIAGSQPRPFGGDFLWPLVKHVLRHSQYEGFSLDKIHETERYRPVLERLFGTPWTSEKTPTYSNDCLEVVLKLKEQAQPQTPNGGVQEPPCSEPTKHDEPIVPNDRSE